MLDMLIPIDKPTLKRKDMAAVLQTMVDETIGPGMYSSKFLSSLSSLLHTSSYSIVLRSYIDALYYGLKALNLPQSSIIGVSALSPYLYKIIIERVGHTVKVFDINVDTKNIDIERIVSVDALLLYEPYGVIAPKELFELGIPTICDISQSIGYGDSDDQMHPEADILIISFEMKDMISTAGGSGLIIQNIDMADSIKDEIVALYPFIALTDLNSALGIIQIGDLIQHIAKREAIFKMFYVAQSRNHHTPFATYDIDEKINGYSFLLIIDGKVEEAINFAKKYEVSVQLAFENAIIKDQLDRYDLYENAIPIIQRTIRFPLYPFLTSSDIKKIERVISQLP